MSNKKIVLIFVVFVSIISTLVIVFADYNSYNNREGKVIKSSDNIAELIKEAPYLSLDELSVKSCRWYQQIRNSNGTFFITTELCYNGMITFEDNFYNSIISKYKWETYNYPDVPVEKIEEDIYGPRDIYRTSMIKDDLRTKTLYICSDNDWVFQDSIFYSFLDKENKILYFYYLQI